MTLHLTDLMELAMLTTAMDAPVPLGRLRGCGAQWHELNGRSDLDRQMSTVLRRMLDEGSINVTEDKVQLVGTEAEMALTRSNDSDSVIVAVTPKGQESYKKLAHRYYNG